MLEITNNSSGHFMEWSSNWSNFNDDEERRKCKLKRTNQSLNEMAVLIRFDLITGFIRMFVYEWNNNNNNKKVP